MANETSEDREDGYTVSAILRALADEFEGAASDPVRIYVQQAGPGAYVSRSLHAGEREYDAASVSLAPAD